MNTYKTLSVYKILQKSPIKSPLVRNIKSVPQIRLTRQRLYIPNKIVLESTFNITKTMKLALIFIMMAWMQSTYTTTVRSWLLSSFETFDFLLAGLGRNPSA